MSSKRVGGALRDEVAHAARFELEHRGGVGRAEDVVGGLVVERQRLERELARGIEALHVAQRPVEDRERGEAEEVELDEADRLDVVLVELRDDRVRARLRVQRAEIGELARRDQHAARVHADVAGETFERFGERQELARLPPPSARARRGAAPSRARLAQRDAACRAGTGSAWRCRRRRGTAGRARGRRRAPRPSRPSCRTSRSATPTRRRTSASRSSITRSRPSWQKSMSKSGIDTRSGFRKRSNRRP